MKLGALPNLCAAVHTMLLDAGSTDQPYEDLARQEVPPAWEARFESAEYAADALKGMVLSDYIDSDALEDEFEDVCGPEDSAIETMATGEDSVVEALVAVIDTDGIRDLHLVLDNIFDGELTNEIKW